MLYSSLALNISESLEQAAQVFGDSWVYRTKSYFFKKIILMFLFTPRTSNRPRDKQPNCFCLLIPEEIVVCVRWNLCKDVFSLHVLLGFAVKVD